MKKHIALIFLLIIISIACCAVFVHATLYPECDHNWGDYYSTDFETNQSMQFCVRCCHYKYVTFNNCNHKWVDAQSDTSSYQHLLKCSICGNRIYEEQLCGLNGHDWGTWEKLSDCNAFKAGLKQRICERVGCECIEEQVIPTRKMTKNEKKVKAVAVKYLKAARNYNIKKMNSCFINPKNKNVYYHTAQVNHIYKKYNKKIKWEIKNITGRSTKYTVTIKLTAPDFYDAMYDAFIDNCIWTETNGYTNLKKIGNHLYKLYRKNIKKTKNKIQTRTVKMTIIKKGSKWGIKKKTGTVVDIATARFHEALNDAYDDYVYGDY